MGELVVILQPKAAWGKWKLYFNTETGRLEAFRKDAFMGEVRNTGGEILLMSPHKSHQDCTAWELMPDAFVAAIPLAVREAIADGIIP